MIKDLTKLADNLDQSGYKNAADSIDQIISTAVMGPSDQKIKQYQQQTSASAVHALLDLLGLIPIAGEGADLANAALYLSEGINPNNLLMAGLSVTSMVPSLGDVSKVIKYGSKMAPDVVKPIAKLVLDNQGVIQAAFAKLKDPKAIQTIKTYVPGGSLLVQYADRMWLAVREWFQRILNEKVKQEVVDTSGITQQPVA
jgi:hypothetical protein